MGPIDDALIDELRSIKHVIQEEIIPAYSSFTGASHQLKDIENSFKAQCSRLRVLQRQLEACIDEADGEEESRHYITILSNEKRDYESIQAAFKAAVTQRREKQRERAMHAREELLKGSHDIAGARKQLKTESDVVRTSENITDSMRRTRNIMAQELEHSGAQIAAIEMSKERLLKARSEYGDQHSMLSKAKGLIKIVDWQNKSERYLLWAGLLLFCMTALYIIQKRFLYFVPYSMRPMALLRYASYMLGRLLKEERAHHQEKDVDAAALGTDEL